MLRRYGGAAWFNLGDRDLGTHLYRTAPPARRRTAVEVTAEIAAAWDVGVRIVPVTDDPARHAVTVADEGEIDFQEYFVRRHHDVASDVGAFRRREPRVGPRRACSMPSPVPTT